MTIVLKGAAPAFIPSPPASLGLRTCLIDGAAIVSDKAGLAALELLRSFRHDHAAVLCIFDQIELEGQDLRSARVDSS